MESNGLRYLISEVTEDVDMILERLKKIKEVKKMEVAGSFRRRKKQSEILIF